MKSRVRAYYMLRMSLQCSVPLQLQVPLYLSLLGKLTFGISLWTWSQSSPFLVFFLALKCLCFIAFNSVSFHCLSHQRKKQITANPHSCGTGGILMKPYLQFIGLFFLQAQVLVQLLSLISRDGYGFILASELVLDCEGNQNWNLE